MIIIRIYNLYITVLKQFFGKKTEYKLIFDTSVCYQMTKRLDFNRFLLPSSLYACHAIYMYYTDYRRYYMSTVIHINNLFVILFT